MVGRRGVNPSVPACGAYHHFEHMTGVRFPATLAVVRPYIFPAK